MTPTRKPNRKELARAKRNAALCHHGRILVWKGGGYFDTQDTTEARERVGEEMIGASVSWDGFVDVERTKS